MSQKKHFGFICAFWVVLFAVGSIQAVMEKVPIESLSQQSETIIYGTVESVSAEAVDGKAGEIYTFVTLSVNQYLKGSPGESFIILCYPGGIVGDIGLWVEDTPTFEVGEKCVVFIQKDAQNYHTVSEWHQGKFQVVNNLVNVDGQLA